MSEPQAAAPELNDDQIGQLFRFFDADGDGFIDENELLLGEEELENDRSAQIVNDMLGTLPPLDKPLIDFSSFSTPPLPLSCRFI